MKAETVERLIYLAAWIPVALILTFITEVIEAFRGPSTPRWQTDFYVWLVFASGAVVAIFLRWAVGRFFRAKGTATDASATGGVADDSQAA